MKAVLLPLVALVAVTVPFSAALREASYRKIKDVSSPAVVLFYDPSDDTTAGHVATMKDIERAVDGFDFYKCDVSKASNAAATAAGLADAAPVVFVATTDDGINQVRLPITTAHLSRYIHLLDADPVPDAVVPFTTEATFYASSLPTFVVFGTPSCPHSFKARRPFQQGAGFFSDLVAFVSVDCKGPRASRRFCDAHDVTAYPSFMLFSGDAVVPYTGGRSVAEFELFFMQHKVSTDGAAPTRNQQLSAASVSAGGDAEAVDDAAASSPSTGSRRATSIVHGDSRNDEGCCTLCRSELKRLTARVDKLERLLKVVMLETRTSRADEDDDE